MKRNVFLGAACALLCVAVQARAGDAKVGEVLAKIPAADGAAGHKLAAELAGLGAPAVRELCSMLVEPGKGDDTKARFALHGLALYVVRPGAEAERAMAAQALVAALEGEKRAEVRKFLVRQLQLAGRDDAVPALGKLLGDAALCEPATQALLRIGTPKAKEALAAALPAATGPCRLTLIRAAGQTRARTAAKPLLADARSKDRTVRLAALHAIANIGDPSAADALAKAAEAESAYERARATAFYVLFARRLAEGGHAQDCARICRGLIRTRTEPRERNVVCAALSTLVKALGKDALDDLMAATEHGDLQVRTAALKLTESLPGEAMTAKWVGKMKAAAPAQKAELLGILAKRGDRSALPAVTEALKDKDQGVRMAAIGAAAQLGGGDSIPPLLAVLEGGEAEEAKAVQTALLRAQGKGVADAAAGALPKASPPSRVALLEVLAARGSAQHAEAAFKAAADTEPGVQAAAMKTLGALADAKALPRLVALLAAAKGKAVQEAALRAVVDACGRIPDASKRSAPVLQAMRSASTAQRALLLRALARLSGPEALKAVVADTKSGDAAVQDAAIRALGEWPDAAAAPELLALARSAKQLTHRVLALRGCVRVVGASPLPDDQKLRLLKDAMAAAKRPDDQRLVLAGLGDVHTVEALNVVAAFLGDSDLDENPLQGEAAAAAVKIACPVSRGAKGLRGTDVVAVLKRAIAVTKDAAIRKRAQDYLNTIPRPDSANLAQGKRVKASVGSQGKQRPELAVDGNYADLRSAWFGERWPCTLDVDLGKPSAIDAAHVYFYWDGGRYYQYKIDVSTDGKAWKTVADASKNKTPGTAAGVPHKFAPVQARYVRLHVLRNSANEAVHLVELKVYAEGKGPKGEAGTPGPALAQPDRR